MSLINEALKKAQRQRTLEAAPLASAPSGVAAAAVATHVRAATHKRSLAPLWFGLGVLAMGVGATVLIMRYAIPESAPVAPVAEARNVAATTAHPTVAEPRSGFAPATPAPTPAAPASSPAAPSPAAEPLVALPPIPRTPAPSVTPPPAATPLAPVPETTPPAPAAPAPVVAAPVAPLAPVAVAPASEAEREAQVYSFLNTLRITGVRGLDREARVLMNERVWRLNDMVSPELGLRLSAVRPGLLVFTDAQGRTYEKVH